MSTFDINQTRATLANTNWDRRRDVTTAHRHRVYTHDCLPLGHFYIDHSRDLIVTGPDTFQALAIDHTVWMATVERFAKGDNGLLFLNMHEGVFAELLRARAGEAGVANVTPRDTIRALQERTQWLIATAQSLRCSNKPATRREIDLFIADRVQLDVEVGQAAESIRRLSAMVELATDLVFAA